MSVYKVKSLIRELETIEHECLPEKMRLDQQNKRGADAEGANAFQVMKRDITFLIRDLREGIRERTLITEKHGRCQQAIEMRSRNQASLDKAMQDTKELKALYEREVKKKKRSKYSEADLESWKSVVQIFEEQIQELDALHNKRGVQRAHETARQMVAARRKEDIQRMKEGKPPREAEEVHMSEQSQAFMERKEEHDREFDKKADQIYDGVKRIQHVAVHIGTELDKQEILLDEVDKQADKVNAQLKFNNKQLKRILKESGGASLWCSRLTAVIILIALIAYIYNRSQN